MNILQILLGLIPSPITIPLPSETFSVELGSSKFTVTTPACSITVTKS